MEQKTLETYVRDSIINYLKDNHLEKKSVFKRALEFNFNTNEDTLWVSRLSNCFSKIKEAKNIKDCQKAYCETLPEDFEFKVLILERSLEIFASAIKYNNSDCLWIQKRGDELSLEQLEREKNANI